MLSIENWNTEQQKGKMNKFFKISVIRIANVLFSFENSLCKFFGEVPHLKSSSKEYEQLFNESLQRLWSFVTDSDDKHTIESALTALRNFDFAELTLKHIPLLYYEQIHIPKEYQKKLAAALDDPNSETLTVADVVPYIPGECWIQFLRHINQNAVEAALGFVKHLIETEMQQYRSGVYMLADGRPEPKELQHLHARSPLGAYTKYIRDQSERYDQSAIVIKCLHCVANKYSRPIPPMNWFFLIEYINHATKFVDSSYDDRFEMTKYALKITSNQIAHSGSAKNLIENYLQDFDVKTKELEEILAVLELIPTICDGVTPNILAKFLRDTLSFLFQLSASSHFEENCHFEQAIGAILQTFDKKCLKSENIDIVMDEIAKFNDLLDAQLKVKYTLNQFLLQL